MIAEHIHIREAMPKDRSHILHVNRYTWEVSYAHIFSVSEVVGLFRGILAQYGSWVYRRNERLMTLVAEVNGEIVGFIGMSSLLNDSAAEITTFYILPDYQGMGIGKQLWQRAIEYLQHEGYSGIWVWVLEKAPARQFYEARGCIQQRKGVYSVGNHKETALGYYLEIP